MKKHYATKTTRGFPLCGSEPSKPFLTTGRTKNVTCLRCAKRLHRKPRRLSVFMVLKTSGREVQTVTVRHDGTLRTRDDT